MDHTHNHLPADPAARLEVAGALMALARSNDLPVPTNAVVRQVLIDDAQAIMNDVAAQTRSQLGREAG